MEAIFIIKLISMEIREHIANYKEKYRRTKEHPFWELLSFAIMAFIIILPIRIFIAEPFIVSGSSMYPTFENGDYLIVDQLSYRFEDPHRGDVVVFKYPKEPKKFFIKRIIGLPGETIEIKNNEVFIKYEKNNVGIKIEEDYIKNMQTKDILIAVKDNEYFVMGDNRNASSDSRVWGTVPKKLLTGRAFLRLLPIKQISIWPGEYKFENI